MSTETMSPAVKPARLWIGGESVDAKDGATFPVINPATGETFTTRRPASSTSIAPSPPPRRRSARRRGR